MSCKTRSPFDFHARFVAFSKMRDGRPRRMLVECQGDRHTMKISKPIRYLVVQWLKPGAWVQLIGEAKRERHSDRIMRKVHTVRPVTTMVNGACEKACLGCIRICSEKNCCKRGAESLRSELEHCLTKCGLNGQVKVESCRCLKNCKKGPSLCMPDGEVLGGVKTRVIERLLADRYSLSDPD
jgi:(2Fe-2S) ferredoxin